MQKMKVMTIIGTRPEIIRLSACIKAFDECFDHVLVHTGQNWDYTLNQIFFDDLSIREPDHYLDSAGSSLGETMGNIIQKSYEILLKEKPEALLILGDTNSALSAICAKRLKIPIFHMEAGNRCFDFNVPEEINRRIVDHVSDIHLAYTEHARRYLISEGLKPEHVFVTGSPMREVLNQHMDKIRSSDILSRLHLKRGQYILVSAHREENIDTEENFLSLMTAINYTAEHYGFPIIYSTHPRSMKFIQSRKFEFHPLVVNAQPFRFTDYNQLQMNAYCVLSDSGTLSEESAMLGFNGVLLRTSTERPEVLDKGTVVIGGIKSNDIEQAIDLSVSLEQKDVIPQDYQDQNVSQKVARLVQSYTKIINQVTWHKS